MENAGARAFAHGWKSIKNARSAVQVPRPISAEYLMVLGLSGIALSMWYSTRFTPDAAFDYFAWVRVYQTIGLPFLFIPINTVAYDGLPANKTNQASALMNVPAISAVV